MSLADAQTVFQNYSRVKVIAMEMMKGGWGLRTHRGVLQDQPRGFLALCKTEIKHEWGGSESRLYLITDDIRV